MCTICDCRAPSIHSCAIYECQTQPVRPSVCTLFDVISSIRVHCIQQSVHLCALYSIVSPSVCTIFYCQSIRMHYILLSVLPCAPYIRLSVNPFAIFLTFHLMCTIFSPYVCTIFDRHFVRPSDVYYIGVSVRLSIRVHYIQQYVHPCALYATVHPFVCNIFDCQFVRSSDVHYIRLSVRPSIHVYYIGLSVRPSTRCALY